MSQRNLTYDNICKYLAEQHPAAFVQWLLAIDSDSIQVLKTELMQEPIRADFLTFLQVGHQILHLEFQVEPYSDPPMPFRMLDYWVRLYRQYRCPIEQIVLFLTRTNSPEVYTSEFVSANTQHRYRVIRLWEQDPTPLLENPPLLPLATLARTETPEVLLQQVSQQVARIESLEQRQNLTSCAQVLAGLRFDKALIRQLFREDIMRQSVIYQDILQQGLQQGQQQGKQQEALMLILRQLNRRFGAISQPTQDRIRGLPLVQLENLAEALLDFSEIADLGIWLETQEPNSN